MRGHNDYLNPPDEEQPCEVCGGTVDVDCICHECPTCGTVGDPKCYHEHGLVYSETQQQQFDKYVKQWQEENQAAWEALYNL